MTGQQFPALFTPVKIGAIEIKNRFFVPAMVTDLGTADGHVTEGNIAFWEARAKGGYGLVIVEATCVDCPEGKGESHGLAIDDDAYIPGMAKLAERIKKYGARAAVQLIHSGIETTRAITGIQPVGPSAIKSFTGEMGRELSVDEIHRITERFAEAVARVKKAGFDAAEIHGATRYLITQFLSPHWNKRQDAYGGPLENRARFMVETIKAAKAAVGPQFPVWVRLNGTEFGLEEGITLEEAQQIAQFAEQSGVDAIHVSAFGAGRRAEMGTPLEYNALLPLAAEIKRVVKVPILAVGRIEVEQGEKAVSEGKIDLVGTGRASLADPELPNKVAAGLKNEIRPCIGCLACLHQLVDLDLPVRCTVNPTAGREVDSRTNWAAKIKNVAVIGAGPAGLEAAAELAARGHRVTLYEKNAKLGGQLLPASVPPGKADIARLASYLENRARKAGVRIINKGMGVAAIVAQKADAVVIAAGGNPIAPNVKGLAEAGFVMAEDVLMGKATVGNRVVIIGGGQVGCETAEYLVNKNKTVAIVEILNKIAADMIPIVRSLLLRRLRDKGVMILTGVTGQEVKSDRIELTDSEGKRREIPFDTIIVACGSCATVDAWSQLKSQCSEVYFIGDSAKPRNIMDAISEGNQVGRSI